MKYSQLPKYPAGAIQRARNLRNNMTETEWKVWGYIRNKQLGVRFKRQVPVGKYIVDFFSLEIGLVIEIDGGQHYSDENKQKDKIRTTYLKRYGLKVIRYNNLEVFENIECVLEHIKTIVDKLKKSYYK